MKKIILACGLIGGLAFASNQANAQTGILHGTTAQSPNGSGGTTITCPSSSNPCTSNTVNPNGTHTILIYNYDRNGNLTGTTVFSAKRGPEAKLLDKSGGYVSDIQTNEGILYGRLEAAN